VSLLKCPDCGQDVSSSARACPHCGRPNRRSSPAIGLSGILVIAVVCAGVLIWRTTSRTPPPVETPSAGAAETIIAEPSRESEGLNASIGYNRRLALFRIENRDDFEWRHCQLSVNAHGMSAGYMRDVESIGAGIAQAALIAGTEFVGDGGRHFDPARETVATLDVACETPRGALDYGAKFAPPATPAGG
jgi:hypothetical protein